MALRRNGALIAAAVALVLQAPSAVNAIAKAAGPITGLNFIENYDAAIFFPMKSLLAEARKKGSAGAECRSAGQCAGSGRCAPFPAFR